LIKVARPTSKKRRRRKRGFEKTHEYLKKKSKGFSCSFDEQRKGKSLRNLQMKETCMGFQSRA